MLLSHWLSEFFSNRSSRRDSRERTVPVSSFRQPRRKHKSRFRSSAAEVLEERALLTAYIVDTLEDGSLAGDGAVSLREAITAANTNAAFLDAAAGEDGPGIVDTITFDPALNGMTITLNGTALSISDDLMISDTNTVPIVVDGNSGSRVFEVAAGAGTVSIADITISGGMADQGGGLYVNSGQTLALNNVMVSGNTATGAAATDGGGGIYNAGGTLNISDSTITANMATGTSGSGGGIFSTTGNVTISTSTISFNEANRAGGGIELVEGTALLTAVNLISNDVDLGTANPGNGGGVHITGAADFTMDGGSVFGNLAGREGGGLWNGSGTMTIQNGTLIQGNEAGGPAADDGGGGIFNNGGTLIVDGSAAPVQIINNVAFGTLGSGGGIFNAGGTATISNSVIDANEAVRAGGGIETAGGILTITNTDLTNNDVDDVVGVLTDANPGNGGAVHIGGSAVVTITGGTISGNTASNEGGGLWNSSGGSLTVDGTAIDGNMAAEGAGLYASPAVANGTQAFTVDLQTLNADFGSTVTGSGTITLDTSGVTSPTSGTATVRVQLNATGLQDVTSIGGLHVAHIHGQFAGNASRPLAAQGAGPFFAGEGGTPVQSIVPTQAADGANNIDEVAMGLADSNYLDFFEGRPAYGPVGLNLTNQQLDALDGVDDGGTIAYPPDGTAPLSYFFQLAGAGLITPTDLFPTGSTYSQDTTYEFDLSDPDQRRQYNNLTPLNTREIVIHGLTIPTPISDAIDAASGAAAGTPTAGIPLGNGMSFRTTAPVAAGTIQAAAGTGHVTISNATISNNTASGNGGGLLNDGGSVTITDTDITGNVSGGDEPGEGGGGVFNDGTLDISGGIISGNTAVVALGNGGGILNAANGTTTITNTTITGNSAARAGGGIESAAALTLSNVDLTNNFAGINGGGLHVSGPASTDITGGTVSGNSAAQEGGGLWNGSGSMTVSGTVVDGNSASGMGADQGGGGIFNAGGSIDISNATIINNLASGGTSVALIGGQEVLAVTTDATGNANLQYNAQTDTFDLRLFITGIALADVTGAHIHVGDSGTNGAVIVNLLDNASFVEFNGGILLTLDDIAFPAANEAALLSGGTYFNVHSTANAGGEVRGQITFPATMGSGGGIFNDQGTITVTGSSISGNIASRAGGGIETNAGEVTLNSVTLDHNIAGPTNAATPGNGGGVHISSNANVTIHNTTVSRNTAREGGGLWNSATGSLTVRNSTIVFNDVAAAGQGGGIFTVDGGTTSLVNTIVAGNNVTGTSTFDEIGGNIAVASSTNNLIADAATSGGLTDGTTGNIVGVGGTGTMAVNTILNPTLTDNGGPTRTHALVTGSLAINAGIDLTAVGITVDQRGVARPIGAAFDIGAVEFDQTLGDPGTIVGQKWHDLNGDGARLPQSVIDLQLFAVNGRYFTNVYGGGEHWYRSAVDNVFHFVLPNGTLTRWDGTAGELTGTVIANLNTRFHRDEFLLTEAQPEPNLNGFTIQLLDAQGNVAASTVTADIDLNGDSNIDPTTETGIYRFTDVAPGNYTIREVAQAGFVQSAGPASVNAVQAFSLNQSLELNYTGNFFTNFGGQNEKWIKQDQGWVYITPDGSLFDWIAGTGGTNGPLRGNLITTLDPTFHMNPQLLFDATNPSVVVASGEVVDGPDFANYQPAVISGRVFADTNQNGVRDAGESYVVGQNVELIDRDGNVVRTVVSKNIDLNSDDTIDPETERGIYSFDSAVPGQYGVRQVLTGSQVTTAPFPSRFSDFAFRLNERLELTFTGNFFENFGANQERWLYSGSLAEWTYITTDGELYEWDGVSTGSDLTGTLITRLDNTFYNNPERLYDAQSTTLTVSSGETDLRNFGVLDIDQLFSNLGNLLN